MIVAGAIVPHAPVLMEPVNRLHGEAVASIRKAASGLAFAGAEALVVLSPHGSTNGVYARARGSLRTFGLPDEPTEAVADAGLVQRLALAWGEPVLDHDLDHGNLVPLRLLKVAGVPVACATFEESLDADSALKVAGRFLSALASVDRPIALVTSAHLSAGLTARAPLGLLRGAEDTNRGVIELLESGEGDRDDVLRRLAHEGGSCSVGPLAVFATVFAGSTTVVGYDYPFGVGYLVAHAP